MNNNELIDTAEALWLIMDRLNAHELDDDETILHYQDNAYGKISLAVRDILTEVLGTALRARNTMTESVETGETLRTCLRYQRNEDHAEAIETAETYLRYDWFVRFNSGYTATLKKLTSDEIKAFAVELGDGVIHYHKED